MLSFVVNKDIVKNVPQDWADLMKPEYANMVALAGDPRASNQAIHGVYAAGLAAGGGDGAKAGEAGLEFFAELNKAATSFRSSASPLRSPRARRRSSLPGTTTRLAGRDTLAGNPPVEVVVPATGVVAGVYVQAISAYAPHPNAAKLWMEYLYSDEGQLGWLKGYCHPIRFNDLAKNGKIPQELLDKLPPAAAYEKAVFPTLEEQAAAKEAITKQWDSVVGANVQVDLTASRRLPRHRAATAVFTSAQHGRSDDAPQAGQCACISSASLPSTGSASRRSCFSR